VKNYKVELISIEKRGVRTLENNQYKGSAWIFVGDLPYDLTEGDVI